MKLYIIAPYPAMQEPIRQTIKKFPQHEIKYGVGDLDQGAKLGIKAEKAGFDIIISRGGTARRIEKSVSIPVIDIGLSGFDFIQTLSIVQNRKQKTALIGFPNIIKGARVIIDLLDWQMDLFTIDSEEEVQLLLQNLKDLGYQYIIGDVITNKIATDFDFNSMLLQSGEETIYQTIERAHQLWEYQQKKQTQDALLVKVFKIKDEQQFKSSRKKIK